MDMKSVEQKWQSRWEKSKINNYDKKSADPKLYILEIGRASCRERV